MAGGFYKRNKVWTRQPQTPVGIDWSNPITLGLEFIYNTRTMGHEAKTGKIAPATGAVAWGAEGFGGTGANGIYLQTHTAATLGSLANSTVFALCRTTAALGTATADINSNGNAIYCERGSSGNDIYKVGLINSGGTLTAQAVYRNDSGTIVFATTSAAGKNDGRLIAIGLTKSSARWVVYCDGTTGADSSPTSSFTDATNESRIGSDKGDANAGWNGAIPLVVGWSRSLSLAELDSLRANPWQLFAPQRRMLFAPAAAVGGGFQAAWAIGSNQIIQGGVQA